MGGCGSVHYKDVPAPEPVSNLTDSSVHLFGSTADPFPSNLGRMSQGTKSDYTLKQGLHMVAEHGKELNYPYFALVWPPALNNINGSSINTAAEVWYLCGARGAREVLSTRSQCRWLKTRGGISAHYSAVYFKEKPVDFVVWDVNKTLADPLVSATDASFELSSGFDDKDWKAQLSSINESPEQ